MPSASSVERAALEERIDRRDAVIHGLEYAVLAFGLPLMIGVIAEVWRHEIIWSVLVAVGVAGEVVIGFLIAGLNSTLRPLRVEERRLHLIELAEIEQRTAEANERAAEAILKAEEEEHARLELERRLSFRFLSLDRRNAMVAALRPYAGLSLVVVQADKEDGETRNATTMLLKVLRGAGLRVTTWAGGRLEPVFGVWIEFAPNRTVADESAAFTLAEGLRDAGWDVEGPRDARRPLVPRAMVYRGDDTDKDNPWRIQVTVGTRPPLGES